MTDKRNRQFPTKISTTAFVKLYILHLLSEKSCYGNEIIEKIKTRLNYKWEPSPGMVYPLLRQLEQDEYILGWWEEPERRTIRHYKITDKGHKQYEHLRLYYEKSFYDSLAILNTIMKDIYKK
ncbi:PadR family transcriptional regulator [Clostridiaceae bacterium M8S5]|nr:PadR family transcriptional regulator [Clostridiaceae bacterium M8S5]